MVQVHKLCADLNEASAWRTSSNWIFPSWALGTSCAIGFILSHSSTHNVFRYSCIQNKSVCLFILFIYLCWTTPDSFFFVWPLTWYFSDKSRKWIGIQKTQIDLQSKCTFTLNRLRPWFEGILAHINEWSLLLGGPKGSTNAPDHGLLFYFSSIFKVFSPNELSQSKLQLIISDRHGWHFFFVHNK